MRLAKAGRVRPGIVLVPAAVVAGLVVMLDAEGPALVVDAELPLVPTVEVAVFRTGWAGLPWCRAGVGVFSVDPVLREDVADSAGLTLRFFRSPGGLNDGCAT